MLYYAAGLVLMGLVLSLLDVLGVAVGAGGVGTVAFLAATTLVLGKAAVAMIDHHNRHGLSAHHQ